MAEISPANGDGKSSRYFFSCGLVAPTRLSTKKCPLLGPSLLLRSGTSREIRPPYLLLPLQPPSAAKSNSRQYLSLSLSPPPGSSSILFLASGHLCPLFAFFEQLLPFFPRSLGVPPSMCVLCEVVKGTARGETTRLPSPADRWTGQWTRLFSLPSRSKHGVTTGGGRHKSKVAISVSIERRNRDKRGESFRSVCSFIAPHNFPSLTTLSYMYFRVQVRK